jgi:hypothetical protein
MTWLLCVTIRKPLAVSSPLIFYVAISGLRSSKKSRACNRVAHFHFASWFNREDGTISHFVLSLCTLGAQLRPLLSCNLYWSSAGPGTHTAVKCRFNPSRIVQPVCTNTHVMPGRPFTRCQRI